jgi:glycosyltransferase involved in cell wall biosynthesis
MKSTVLIITNNYPYLPGEEFFEEEVKYWSEKNNVRVIILPLNSQGERRVVPSDVKVLELKSTSKIEKALYLLPGIFSFTFFKEVSFLIKQQSFNASKLYSLIKSCGKIALYIAKIEKIIKSEQVDLVYTYWNTEASYACASIKNNGKLRALVTRLHGYDIYEERSLNKYIPSKRQFLEKYDKLYVISEQAKRYLIQNYRVNQGLIELARLGVNISPHQTLITDQNTFHLLSVSYCAPVKRLDKVIDALALMAPKSNGLTLKWTHIGGGELLAELSYLAKSKLDNFSNVQYNFIGALPNEEVKLFYQNNSVDCFINVSESEGVPVSIMEAMGYGVPAIAPDVGGISELVDNRCGQLMSSNPDVNEICASLKLMSEKAKLQITRVKARDRVNKLFNSSLNYQVMVDSVLEHVK